MKQLQRPFRFSGSGDSFCLLIGEWKVSARALTMDISQCAGNMLEVRGISGTYWHQNGKYFIPL
jgi:hypothetical protein